jgi:excisionase family DNA binding protein
MDAAWTVHEVRAQWRGKPMSSNDEVLTIAEVAEDLRCSKAHVANMIKGRVKGAQPLPAITMGRRKLVRRSTLERWKRVSEAAGGGAILAASPETDADGRMKGTFHA